MHLVTGQSKPICDASKTAMQ